MSGVSLDDGGSLKRPLLVTEIGCGGLTALSAMNEMSPGFMEHEHLLQSANGLIDRVMHRLQMAVSMAISQVRQRLVQGFVVFSVTLLLLWMSVFLYGSFYYSYMPRAAYSTPVHYYYRTDCESSGSFMCSYPVANISLMKSKKHVLTFGQAYRLSLQLEMPESLANQELGMFIVRTTCFSQDRGQVASSARALSASSSHFSMLRYRSDLVRTLETLLLLPAFLTGTAEQKQTIEVELFSEYTDDPYAPSDTAIIEILSNKVQIYSSQLFIHAHFTGLRYLLFTFPLLSAVVGVSSNFIFLSVLFVLSYMRQMFRFKQIPMELTVQSIQSTREEAQREEQNDRGSTEPLGHVQVTSTTMHRNNSQPTNSY